MQPYAKRKGLDVLILASYLGGQMINTNDIDNYLGFSKIAGPELVNHFTDHITSLDIPVMVPVFVEKITKVDKNFIIYLDDDTMRYAKTVVLATGVCHEN